MSILQVNSCSIDPKSGEIWPVQANLQQISFKPDSLLVQDIHLVTPAAEVLDYFLDMLKAAGFQLKKNLCLADREGL